MDITQLSTAHFEDGMNILSELDITPLITGVLKLRTDVPELDFKAKAEEIVGQILQNPKALEIVMPILQTGGLVGRNHILRRISAVMQASEDTLLDAERDSKKLLNLEADAARRPFLACAGDLVGFFTRLGISVNVSQGSSEPKGALGTEEAKAEGTPGATPSGVS